MQELNLIREFPGFDIKQNQALSTYTNTRVGGPADWIFWPRNLNELRDVTRYAQNQGVPITVLGNASNLIITDQGLRGLVVFLTRLTDITVDETTVTAAAGAAIIDTAQVACEHDLAGLEWAAGIPGSVGGAVYMNAGAYGGQVDDCLLEAVVLTPSGTLKTYTRQELDFGYRHSAVQGTGEIIVSATFKLIPDAKANIAERMEDFNDRRASKQPLEYPSCGSVFKRPEGYFAGKLIMDAGLQGFQVGGAQVSTKHAGFIVNKGQATGSDYVAVIKHVQDVVHEQYQVNLEPEVRILGE
ncbi:UDP-N-acetylmuramate dehydrogenase [Weissella viridescens]|uniref:UDP-N-acetylenolpyruvoylglucosamine reductase n=1 Tax=Weissella viridescens TaxID=1629 RepID=A0A3P2RJA4_WEIVI|nr:UDP-N-acetylmuramate dehydrogenase [Weissella viridescens]RRG17508.1 UDP-N-acetylmuramate dehydrogenase [Weissella viridescens]